MMAFTTSVLLLVPCVCCCRSPQLTVNLPGGVAYCAVDTSIPGAPLRTVTVRDAIGDLPSIQNGHDK
jgi:DNA (cytosine-5)-methyltransferase 1